MQITSKPQVTVIIPAYNRAYVISRSIASVLAQTYPYFEIIVVDDGSVDNTEAVVKSFKDSRIKYIRHEVNKGISAVRNTGINEAAGEYIAFLDSDDEWLPTKLEKQMHILKNKSLRVSVAYTMSKMPAGSGFQYVPLGGPKEGNIFGFILGGDFP